MTSTDRRTFLSALSAATAATALPRALSMEPNHPSSDYTLAAYYFGNYHVDPRNETAHGPGWTEWRLVQQAMPRFTGHAQPKSPLWGFEDESDPTVFARKIIAASNAGLSAFIFDWYWYNDGPFLQGALEKGYLAAANKNEVKFAIMWANHDWMDIQPAKLTAPGQLQFSGAVTIDTFRHMTDHIVKTYFSEPSYWSIDNCPYFSIYQLYKFVEAMGGVQEAANALREFREKTRSAGFRDLHINAITWGVEEPHSLTDASNLKSISSTKGLLQDLEIDSTTSYVWIHHAEMDNFPVTQYEKVAQGYYQYRSSAAARFGKPYFPNVSMGWDSSPRACQSDIYVKREYPFLPVVQGNTPEAFAEALRSAKRFLDDTPELQHKILTINSWNEWTEGSYLEPDTQTKYQYLDQIEKVFAKSKSS
jgi:hypothetical protein